MSTSFDPTTVVVTGATVALLARSGDEPAESARRVRAAGARALVAPADLGDLG